jgi:Histone-like transcription factor (CBF/NF-Y) and archaeal histone
MTHTPPISVPQSATSLLSNHMCHNKPNQPYSSSSKSVNSTTTTTSSPAPSPRLPRSPPSQYYFNSLPKVFKLESTGVEKDRMADLPIANISRIMKNALPDNAKIAKDAKECVQECVTEFIAFITSEGISLGGVGCGDRC